MIYNLHKLTSDHVNLQEDVHTLISLCHAYGFFKHHTERMMLNSDGDERQPCLTPLKTEIGRPDSLTPCKGSSIHHRRTLGKERNFSAIRTLLLPNAS